MTFSSFRTALWAALGFLYCILISHGQVSAPAPADRSKLSIVSGGGQRDIPGKLATPLRVVVDSGVYDAAVTFSVTRGHAKLSKSGSTPAKNIEVRSITPFINAEGEAVYVAEAVIHLPANVGEISYIDIKANGALVGTTATVCDPNLQPPKNFTASVETGTSALLKWTPSHPELPTSVEMSEDGGANWTFRQTVPAGKDEVVVEHLVPNRTVWFRLFTGDRSEEKATPEEATPKGP